MCVRFSVATSVSGAYIQRQQTVQGIGYVEPVGEVLRLNFKHPGVISESLVILGQPVKKGDVLARLSHDEEQALLAVEQADAGLAKAQLKQVMAGVNSARIHAQ